jgi:general secretion pathway protein A
MSQTLQALYGLKWNPFGQELPSEALRLTRPTEDFLWRIEHQHVREGGFALVHGDPGTGKSVVLRLLYERLERQPDMTVAVLNHPQSNVADFYRELGEVFGVSLKPHNRWGGFKSLRERWLTHLEGTRLRPVLIIDEAQEMEVATLSELRLMTSSRFDSRPLLGVVLAGDSRLTDLLKRDDLLPLGSRIRARLTMDYAGRDDLSACLEHLLATAGNANLMTPQLRQVLCDHAAGNYRILTNMAAQLLSAAVQRQAEKLDEKLYFEVFADAASPTVTKIRGRGGR